MKKIKSILPILTVFLCFSATTANAQTYAVQPDNTEVNMRDRNAGELTADQQKENQSDREIIRLIRQSLMKDKSLSTYAHNIKIISQDGIVTLKGPVRSDAEKQTIISKALNVTGGMDKVNDEISIKR